MAATDARPVPQKNVAYRVTFPILDADGDLVTAAAALDSERSLDGAIFVDCTNEATEIATSSGMYFLDLTAAEMNADTVAIIVKTTTTGAKTTAIVLYPEEAGDIRVNLTQWSGTAPNALVTGRVDSSTGAMATDVVTAAAIAAGAIDAATFAAGAIDNAAFNVTETLTANPAPGGIVAASFAAGAINAAAIATGAIDADAIALDAADEIIGAVSGTADSGTTTTVVDAERTEADTDYWKGSLIVFTSGTLNGQARLITGFAPASDTVTFAPATTVAVGTHTYRIIPAGRADLHSWLGSAANPLIAGRVDANAQVVGDKTGYALTTAEEDAIVNKVWDELTAEARTAGSYGQLVKDDLNATVSSRSSHAAADIWTAATRRLTSVEAADLVAAAANKIADHVLRRTYANARASGDGDAVNFRSLLGAVGKLVNKWAISGTTLTVYQEDDLTSTAPGGTQALTTDAAANPIVTVDTA